MPAFQPYSGRTTPKEFTDVLAPINPPKLNPKTGKPAPVSPGRGHNSRAMTRDLKQGIIDAATAYGSDGKGSGGLSGYLFFLAGKHPKAFSSLLGKMLPLQVNGATSLVGQVNIVSVPAGKHLNAVEISELAKTIEHEPATAAVEPEDEPAE